MRDYITIGSTPCDEDCLQLGTDPPECWKAETRLFCEQLREERPDHAHNIRVKSFPHDFGTYTEVVVWYDSDNEEETRFAFKLESESPTHWDEKRIPQVKELWKKARP